MKIKTKISCEYIVIFLLNLVNTSCFEPMFWHRPIVCQQRTEVLKKKQRFFIIKTGCIGASPIKKKHGRPQRIFNFVFDNLCCSFEILDSGRNPSNLNAKQLSTLEVIDNLNQIQQFAVLLANSNFNSKSSNNLPVFNEILRDASFSQSRSFLGTTRVRNNS